MQVFVCSGWTENLRKWETLVPNPFCAWFKGWGSEWSSENRPDTLGPEFLPVKPMRCVLVFGLRVVFVTSFCPQSHPWHRPPGEGCWGQSTALSPNCCRSHVGLWVLVFKVLGWREEEEDGALLYPSQGSLTAFTQKLQCSSYSPQWALPPCFDHSK